MSEEHKRDTITAPISQFPSTTTLAVDEKGIKWQTAPDEPQNALTSRFTKEEWEALRALRVGLLNGNAGSRC